MNYLIIYVSTILLLSVLGVYGILRLQKWQIARLEQSWKPRRGFEVVQDKTRKQGGSDKP